MATRAKFNLNSITSVDYGNSYASKQYEFSAVYDDGIPENQRFAKASPSGQLKITIDNPAAQEFFAGKVGKSFYLDVTEAT
jgi:hypothetical protein